MSSIQPDPAKGATNGQPVSSAGTSQSQQYNTFEGFTRFYLETYYAGPPSIDERAINRFINEELIRLERRWESYVEISGEGTVHHMIPFTPHVKKFYSTDFRDDAREETRKWVTGTEDAFCWDHYVEMALQNEGIEPTKDAIATRVREMREKVQRITGCDVTRAPIVDTLKIPLTANTITGVFFVSGEVGETVPGWEKVMENISKSIAPGGQLIMSALRGMKEYEVKRCDGSVVTYPCAELYGHHFRNLLPRLGFSNVVVEELEIPEPDVGLPGINMVSATKTNG